MHNIEQILKDNNLINKKKYGYSFQEIEKIKKFFIENYCFNISKFEDELLCNTCALINNKVYTYTVDIHRAIRAGLGEFIHPYEWD
jgi:hypothetical protein